jgi:hypothetical protein
MIQTGDPLGDGTGGESMWGGEFEVFIIYVYIYINKYICIYIYTYLCVYIFIQIYILQYKHIYS